VPIIMELNMDVAVVVTNYFFLTMQYLFSII
jgi:hypothetical protein